MLFGDAAGERNPRVDERRYAGRWSRDHARLQPADAVRLSEVGTTKTLKESDRCLVPRDLERIVRRVGARRLRAARDEFAPLFEDVEPIRPRVVAADQRELEHEQRLNGTTERVPSRDRAPAFSALLGTEILPKHLELRRRRDGPLQDLVIPMFVRH